MLTSRKSLMRIWPTSLSRERAGNNSSARRAVANAVRNLPFSFSQAAFAMRAFTVQIGPLLEFVCPSRIVACWHETQQHTTHRARGHASGSRLVAAVARLVDTVEEIVEHQFLGTQRPAQQAIQMHVNDAGSERGEGDREASFRIERS